MAVSSRNTPSQLARLNTRTCQVDIKDMVAGFHTRHSATSILAQSSGPRANQTIRFRHNPIRLRKVTSCSEMTTPTRKMTRTKMSMRFAFLVVTRPRRWSCLASRRTPQALESVETGSMIKEYEVVVRNGANERLWGKEFIRQKRTDSASIHMRR